MTASSPAAPAGPATQPWPAWADRRGPLRPQLSVVVPTYNEAESLPIMLDRLDLALAELDYEVVVVDDDSPDGTWRLAEEAARRSRRVRVLRRIGRRGLSSAVVEGLALAQGEVLAVMDADGQHDESILPAMAAAVADGADVCIGSRAVEGGSYGAFSPQRRLVSWGGAQLARALVGVDVSDPMSGFFALSRSRWEATRAEVTGRGFKILLELLARGERPAVAEIGYHFRLRTAGTTKLSGSVVTAYLASVTELLASRLAASRFVVYGLIALLGTMIRSSVLAPALGSTGGAPLVAGAGIPLTALLAAEMAVIVEYLAHDRATFPHRSHHRWHHLGPLARFHLVTAQAMAAVAGADRLIGQVLLPAGGPQATLGQLMAALVLNTTAITGTVVTSFLLNTRITWPPRPAWRARAANGRSGQTMRSMTSVTSPSISATARR
ncbi:MAG: glycosyltransferase [Acidimicrobiia bacterium]|nr:glycosyltransferase [Acidimicrobiia bacterium]